MTTDDLTERIARILNDEGWTFEGVHEPGEYDECEDCRRVVDPIAARIAEEVAAHDARVRRDAARGALDGAAAYIDSRVSWLAGTEVHSPRAQDVLYYRDTHYPKENR